jgi:hypothetical protein
VGEDRTHYGRTHPVEMPDTGSLRGDMLALLGGVNDARYSFTVGAIAAFADLLASTGLTPADVRARILSDRPRIAAIVDDLFLPLVATYRPDKA